MSDERTAETAVVDDPDDPLAAQIGDVYRGPGGWYWMDRQLVERGPYVRLIEAWGECCEAGIEPNVRDNERSSL